MAQSKDLVETEVGELIPSSIIKTEANLANLPFFALSRREMSGRSKTEYKISAERDGRKLDVLWRVSASTEYGYPGPFDRKVHKAIEYIINEQGIPIENPIPFSMYQIAKILGVTISGGTNYRRIREALERTVATTVKSEGTFYSKKKRQYISDVFHIYDRVVFKEQALPNGEIADTNYLFVSQWYLDSINAFYVRPIDFDYFRQLRSDIAGRLYELLGLKLYGVISNRGAYWRVEYKELCNLLPITTQKYLSNAKRYLDPAHQELVETHFLSRVVWDTEDKNHWYIRYYPGKRAREEVKSRPMVEQLELEAPKEIQSDTCDDTPDEEDLASALQKRGVSRRQAHRLVEERKEWVNRAIELWELERKKSPDRMQNPAGYLVSIIEAGEDWQPPDGYVSSEEKRDRGEKKRRDDLVEELVSLTDDNTPPSKLLIKSDKPPTIKELEREVTRIRAEKANGQQDRKAWIEQVLEGLSDKEREAIRTEALSSVDEFLRSSGTFKELSQQDIREWQGSGPVVSPLISKRDEIIRERYR